MATCKDCIHSGICVIQLEPRYLLDKVQKLMRESNNVERECLSFKSCSRFVELPCNINDVVYRIKAKQIIKSRVNRFEINRLGVELVAARRINLGWDDEFGTKLFLTREEAEQALKERDR